MPFTASQRQEVHKVLGRFIATAVVRHDVGQGLGHRRPDPEGRGHAPAVGQGDLPVIPYPGAEQRLGELELRPVLLHRGAEAHRGARGIPLSEAELGMVGNDCRRRGGQKARTAAGWSTTGCRRSSTARRRRRPSPRQRRARKSSASATPSRRRQSRSRHRATRCREPDSQPRARGAWWALPLGLLGLAVAHSAGGRRVRLVPQPEGGTCVLPLGHAMATQAPARRTRLAAVPAREPGDAWRVIVLNDDHNTFQGVAFALASVLPSTSYEQGMELANRIHNTGQAIVWSGHRESGRAVLESAREPRPDHGSARERVGSKL